MCREARDSLRKRLASITIDYEGAKGKYWTESSRCNDENVWIGGGTDLPEQHFEL